MLKKLSLIFVTTSITFSFAGLMPKPVQALECVTRDGSTICQTETTIHRNGCRTTRTAHPNGSVTSRTICPESSIQQGPEE